MARRRNIDPMAKRADETNLQWRARLARIQETKRGQGEDIVTPERLKKGDLEQTSGKSGVVRFYRQRSTSSLARLCARGVIDSDQLAAAQEVAIEAERLGRDASLSSGGITEQVDCSGSGKGFAEEALHRVCMERAYTNWREALPAPKGMVLAMLLEDNKLAAIASRNGRSWRKAVEVLKEALNVWPQFKRDAFKGITQDDVNEANRRVA